MVAALSLASPSADAGSFSRAFKALGELNRLRVFALIASQESICVGDLVTVLDLPQSTVSRHLATLRQAGLLSTRRDGTWIHYQLSDAPEQRALVDMLAEVALQSGAFSDDSSRAASLAALGGCCPHHPDSRED